MAPRHEDEDEVMSSSDNESVSASESEPESDSEHPKRNQPTLFEKDSDEEELENLVLGNKDAFRANLFRGDWLSTKDGDPNALQLVDPDDSGMEEVDDADLFMFDTGAPSAKAAAPKKEKEKKKDENAPVWEDSDDDRLTISLAGAPRLRKLRVAEAEDEVTGTEYCRRLREHFLMLQPTPAWAREAEARPVKRRRKSEAADDSSANSSEDEEDDINAQPLETFLRDVRKLAGLDAGKRRRLRPEVLDIQRTREIPDRHQDAVASLSFHPDYPVLLSASAASILFLHHIDPEAQPTPNPQLTSVQVQQVDTRHAEFQYPTGDRIFFAGRRRYFHSWDLKSGLVQKTNQIVGHRLEHRTMERFRLSPCGRYMGIISSKKKGGGVVNVISTVTTQWIAAARLSGHGGVADFQWWRNGEGMTILGRDGQVGEYNMASKSFVGVWNDEGCIGGIVIGLGGIGGPANLGEDKWVAVGSRSGIVNIYERSELLSSTGPNIALKERPSPRRVFEQLITPITVISFSPDGQLLAFASYDKKDALKMVHLPSCTVYKNWPTAETPLGKITAVAFGRGSDVLAVGNKRGQIRLWQIRS